MKDSVVEARFDSGPPEDNQEKFQQVMESRWRYAVFPAMVMFVLLIGFMFYLIYGMLQRMEDLAEDIDKMTGVIADSLPVMQGGVVSMSSRVQWMGDDIKKMSTSVNHMSNVVSQSMPTMTRSIDGMKTDISTMAYATNSMSQTTHNMGQNIWDMNRNISGGPFGMMKDMMPFSKKSAPPPQAMYNYYPKTAQPYIPPRRSSVRNAVAPTAVPAAAAVPAMGPQATVDSAIAASSSKYAGFCASCHGIAGEGGVGPNLKDHSAASVVAVLEQYRTGELQGTMTGVVKEMSDDDIQTVASFVGSNL